MINVEFTTLMLKKSAKYLKNQVLLKFYNYTLFIPNANKNFYKIIVEHMPSLR